MKGILARTVFCSILTFSLASVAAEQEKAVVVGKACKNQYEQMVEWQAIGIGELGRLPNTNPNNRFYEAFPFLIFFEVAYLLGAFSVACITDGMTSTYNLAYSSYHSYWYKNTYILLQHLDDIYTAMKTKANLSDITADIFARRFEEMDVTKFESYGSLIKSSQFRDVQPLIANFKYSNDALVKILLAHYLYSSHLCGERDDFRPLTLPQLSAVLAQGHWF